MNFDYCFRFLTLLAISKELTADQPERYAPVELSVADFKSGFIVDKFVEHEVDLVIQTVPMIVVQAIMQFQDERILFISRLQEYIFTVTATKHYVLVDHLYRLAASFNVPVPNPRSTPSNHTSGLSSVLRRIAEENSRDPDLTNANETVVLRSRRGWKALKVKLGSLTGRRQVIRPIGTATIIRPKSLPNLRPPVVGTAVKFSSVGRAGGVSITAKNPLNGKPLAVRTRANKITSSSSSSGSTWSMTSGKLPSSRSSSGSATITGRGGAVGSPRRDSLRNEKPTKSTGSSGSNPRSSISSRGSTKSVGVNTDPHPAVPGLTQNRPLTGLLAKLDACCNTPAYRYTALAASLTMNILGLTALVLVFYQSATTPDWAAELNATNSRLQELLDTLRQQGQVLDSMEIDSGTAQNYTRELLNLLMHTHGSSTGSAISDIAQTYVQRVVDAIKNSPGVQSFKQLFESALDGYVAEVMSALGRLHMSEVASTLWPVKDRQEFIDNRTSAAFGFTVTSVLDLKATLRFVDPNDLLVTVAVSFPEKNATLRPYFFAPWDGFVYLDVMCGSFDSSNMTFAVITAEQFTDKNTTTVYSADPKFCVETPIVICEEASLYQQFPTLYTRDECPRNADHTGPVPRYNPDFIKDAPDVTKRNRRSHNTTEKSKRGEPIPYTPPKSLSQRPVNSTTAEPVKANQTGNRQPVEYKPPDFLQEKPPNMTNTTAISSSLNPSHTDHDELQEMKRLARIMELFRRLLKSADQEIATSTTEQKPAEETTETTTTTRKNLEVNHEEKTTTSIPQVEITNKDWAQISLPYILITLLVTQIYITCMMTICPFLRQKRRRREYIALQRREGAPHRESRH